MSNLLPQDIVDIEHYPLHEIESVEARRLVTRCRQELDDKALCCSPSRRKLLAAHR